MDSILNFESLDRFQCSNLNFNEDHAGRTTIAVAVE